MNLYFNPDGMSKDVSMSSLTFLVLFSSFSLTVCDYPSVLLPSLSTFKTPACCLRHLLVGVNVLKK